MFIRMGTSGKSIQDATSPYIDVQLNLNKIQRVSGLAKKDCFVAVRSLRV